MKVLIVGYGSMGRRRIRLLKEVLSDVEFLCVDSNEERQKSAAETGIKVYSTLQDALKENIEVAFVCTSPGTHADIILQLVQKGINVFTELNLTADKYEEIERLAIQNQCTVFMSSTMLYNKQVCKIKELVKETQGALTYMYHIGQYLPDWHPWESYKDFFIGQKATNGVREIFAIQLPWIIETFGSVKNLTASTKKCTGLDIEFEDSAIVLLQHENGHRGVFVADTVSRKAVTSLEIVGEQLHLFWNGHNDDLYNYNIETKASEQIMLYDQVKHEDGYADNIIENQYIDEIKNFVNVVKGIEKPKYSLQKDKYILSLIDEIEGV